MTHYRRILKRGAEYTLVSGVASLSTGSEAEYLQNKTVVFFSRLLY